MKQNKWDIKDVAFIPKHLREHYGCSMKGCNRTAHYMFSGAGWGRCMCSQHAVEILARELEITMHVLGGSNEQN